MKSEVYSQSRHRQILVLGGGMLVAGIGLFSFCIVALAIGVFDKLQIRMDEVSIIAIVPALISVAGVILIVVGLVKAFRVRKAAARTLAQR
ncbi:hypothetical protein LGM39_19300 [Burkholderia cepacia]|uniref:hypothetical protein n=1 Tax=Burkholderia cepacia TaxID=292 RepID=UPI001CF37A6E|nr:hypothetical protein [Burkholderia cepacia]MCA7901522.1 hypothetical protein [Burkholderia cepacia]